MGSQLKTKDRRRQTQDSKFMALNNLSISACTFCARAKVPLTQALGPGHNHYVRATEERQ